MFNVILYSLEIACRIHPSFPGCPPRLSEWISNINNIPRRSSNPTYQDNPAVRCGQKFTDPNKGGATTAALLDKPATGQKNGGPVPPCDSQHDPNRPPSYRPAPQNTPVPRGPPWATSTCFTSSATRNSSIITPMERRKSASSEENRPAKKADGPIALKPIFGGAKSSANRAFTRD